MAETLRGVDEIFDDAGPTDSTETFRRLWAITEELMANIVSKGVDAVGVMHTKLPVMAPALAVLDRLWGGPKLAYAETGRAGVHDWSFDEAVAPDAYARSARTWIRDYGVRIVGGCCGTGPEHIRELNRTIRSAQKHTGL